MRNQAEKVQIEGVLTPLTLSRECTLFPEPAWPRRQGVPSLCTSGTHRVQLEGCYFLLPLIAKKWEVDREEERLALEVYSELKPQCVHWWLGRAAALRAQGRVGGWGARFASCPLCAGAFP